VRSATATKIVDNSRAANAFDRKQLTVKVQYARRTPVPEARKAVLGGDYIMCMSLCEHYLITLITKVF